ncbi:MAG: DUF2061 domain-containing protein [Paracoccaceae bacterium]
METRKRTVLKALIWNLIGLISMSLVGLAMTGSIAVGAVTAAINGALGFTMYFAYERVWGQVRWGLHG